tara:strand:+ start:1865 stop:2083 length:219 start_codon:yes stop_codon:yes gene_type:complete
MSNEADLELKLSAYNAKIVFLNKIYRNLCKIKLGHLIYPKIAQNIESRNQCFRDLRDLIKKKRPELFIGSEY